MTTHPLVNHMRAIARIIGHRALRLWRTFRSLRPLIQGAIVLAVIVAFFVIGTALAGAKKEQTPPAVRSVTLQTLSALAGAQASSTVLGSVRSVTEAELLAQAGGTVTSVTVSIGQSVGAGSVIAELENSAQRAAVLQAEGAYDAAVASRASVSPLDSKTAAFNKYRDAFTVLDTTLQNSVDTFFGAQTPAGPNLLINPADSNPTTLSRARAELGRTMHAWSEKLSSATTRDPETYLAEAEADAYAFQTFLESLAVAANKNDSRATTTQLASLASARASVSATLASLANAKVAYRSGSTSSTASVDAGVKSALGNLRYAQSNLEKTVVRAPIAGTVNFLPIRVGEYVTPLSHVATVAQNGALEVVAFVSEDTRTALTIGTKVTVNTSDGIITSIAPALDPVTKQIEIHVAVTSGSTLVNGQSVHIGLPEGVVPEVATTSETTTGIRLLPLTSVKLSAGSRILFMVQDGRLVAIPVEIADVRGDRLEVITNLPDDARIVTDARGLSAGQAVNIISQ